MDKNACWIRNGKIFDVDPDSMHTDAVLEDPEWFGLSWGYLNDVCKAFNFDSVADLRYDDEYLAEDGPWRELMDAALEKGAVRVRYYHDNIFIDAYEQDDVLNALLECPQEFSKGTLNVTIYGPTHDFTYKADSVLEAINLLENKKETRPRLKEDVKSFDCKDDKLFDNIQDAIFSLLTDYDEEVWEKAGIKRYFEEPSTHGVLVRDQYGSKVFPIHYGLNGPGKDEDYFTAMAKLIVDLEDLLKPTYPEVKVYCVNVIVDCADDVGTVVFGVRVGEDIDPKESMDWLESPGGVGKPQDSDEEKTSEWNKGVYKIDHYNEEIDEWEK